MPERWLVTIAACWVGLDMAASLPCRGSAQSPGNATALVNFFPTRGWRLRLDVGAHIEPNNHSVSRRIPERFVKTLGHTPLCARTPRSLATAFAKPVVLLKSFSAASDVPGIAQAGMICLFDKGNRICLANNLRICAGAGHKAASHPLNRAIARGTRRNHE